LSGKDRSTARQDFEKNKTAVVQIVEGVKGVVEGSKKGRRVPAELTLTRVEGGKGHAALGLRKERIVNCH